MRYMDDWRPLRRCRPSSESLVGCIRASHVPFGQQHKGIDGEGIFAPHGDDGIPQGLSSKVSFGNGALLRECTLQLLEYRPTT